MALTKKITPSSNFEGVGVLTEYRTNLMHVILSAIIPVQFHFKNNYILFGSVQFQQNRSAYFFIFYRLTSCEKFSVRDEFLSYLFLV